MSADGGLLGGVDLVLVLGGGVILGVTAIAIAYFKWLRSEKKS